MNSDREQVMAEELTTFQERPVAYVETTQVKEGVECDIYSFKDNDDEDLAIVRVAKGAKTPMQKIVQGNKTLEGFISGKGTLTVCHDNGNVQIHNFDEALTKPAEPIEVKIGQIVQWSADVELSFYEICDPPYQDGRFENLQEGTTNG